ncbi:unnamed protein product [Wuchereria bancrofti]|uniref:EF-hand domain-containing protein n=1 Tax=Wuchereria bancrofti TaxID=6293 RepID=A0A3P7FJG1_WUCBA|nr:unnamed protein product [Wuchereria bancrofti]
MNVTVLESKKFPAQLIVPQADENGFPFFLISYLSHVLFRTQKKTYDRHYYSPSLITLSPPLITHIIIFRTTMGNESSLPMEMCSNFDAYELRRLARRFKKLDLDGSGSLSVDEFMSLPELQQNPLVQRVIDIFDEDGDGEVDFREFIQGISQFSVKGDKTVKLKFAFRIYDMDRDGYISNGELFQVLKMMVGNNLKDNQLQQIVDKTILFHDKDGDGKISHAFLSTTSKTIVARSRQPVSRVLTRIQLVSCFVFCLEI